MAGLGTLRGIGRIGMVIGAALLLLSACDTPPITTTGSATPAPDTQSAESKRIQAYYRNIQDRLLAQGLLRTDGGGPDTPFTARQLADDFMRIALYDEYVVAGGHFVAAQTPAALRRWTKPVRMQMIFGASSDAARRQLDQGMVKDYASRLARISRHDIRVTNGTGNIFVLFLNKDEQKAFGPRLKTLIPRIDDVTLNEVVNSPRSTFCAAFGLSDPDKPGTYESAVVLIKQEHTDLMRQGCIHEELAQVLGLVNDSPDARPSIFNDDEEFSLLTRHDELLLRMLYDPRLKPGMTAAEARPIVETIAAELMGGGA